MHGYETSYMQYNCPSPNILTSVLHRHYDCLVNAENSQKTTGIFRNGSLPYNYMKAMMIISILVGCILVYACMIQLYSGNEQSLDIVHSRCGRENEGKANNWDTEKHDQF